MDLPVAADNLIKMKESEKIDTYLDLARELKLLWKMMVKVILIPVTVWIVIE